MGINNGKFYDAEQSAQYYEYLNTSKKAYDGYADVTRLANNDFDANPLFIGMTARALKKFIKLGTGKLINDTTDMHDMMIKDQRFIMESFESMVDPSSNARIEYDTLEIINNDFKHFYRRFKEIASETNSIMDDLNAEFGDEVPGDFPYPNSKAALASFEDICGGDNPEGGYFKECQNRLVEFDNTMNSYLKGRETPFNSADLNKRMKAVSDIIWGYHYDDPKMAKSNVEVIGNPNIKTVRNLNDRLDMFCGNIDNYFHGKGNDIAITQGELRRNGGGTFLCPFGAIEAANNPLSKKIISLPFYNHFKNYITENARKHPVNRDAYRVTPMESALAFEVGGAMKSFIEKGNLSNLRKNALVFYNDFQQGGVNSMIDLVAGTCTLTGVSNLLANSNAQNAALPNAMTVPGLLNANTLATGMNIPITNLWNHFGNVISEQGLSSLKNYFQTAGYVSVYGASFFDKSKVVASPSLTIKTLPKIVIPKKSVADQTITVDDSKRVRSGAVDENFIIVTGLYDSNGNPDTGFGGAQKWFKDEADMGELLAKYGCGVIASVNQYLYLTGQKTISKEDYMKLVYEYLDAKDLIEPKQERYSERRRQQIRGPVKGAFPGEMTDFVTNMCEKEGVNITSNWDYTKDYEADYDSMKQQLDNGIPVVWGLFDCGGEEVAFYSYEPSTGEYSKVDGASSHYVTATAIYEETDDNGNLRRMVEISSWGQTFYVDYDQYIEVVSDARINNPFSSITYTEIK
ncbi:hypothetical protein D6853_07015 [Butyrivibrio sp. X503]|uniref:T7SS effector LXG polymorphic toxin n=1 Tax=Butyrivibrio sp. X503 TaxID=2364878 RepID=UPI000EA9B73D|nr:T7SS effector LXG polymorphic toxin [Butyrivibrio sp. X503]RKM56531.1 hypothetical protein D6853_07015 [Butyrivibrio sp. X503]